VRRLQEELKRVKKQTVVEKPTAASLVSLSLSPTPSIDDGLSISIQQALSNLVNYQLTEEDVSSHINGLTNPNTDPIEVSLSAAVSDSRSSPLQDLIDLFVLLNTKRESFISSHLSSLSQSLSPCLPLQFLSWLLNQSDAVHEKPNSLFSSLFMILLVVSLLLSISKYVH